MELEVALGYSQPQGLLGFTCRSSPTTTVYDALGLGGGRVWHFSQFPGDARAACLQTIL